MMRSDPRPSPSYVMIHDETQRSQPKKNCCLQFICCCYCCIFFIILINIAVALYIYTFYKPSVPSYKIMNMNTKSFSATPSSNGAGYNIRSSVEVTVEATNHNSHIGLEYLDGSSVTVKYKDVMFCSGKLPSFFQGHDNVTVFTIQMSGDSMLNSDDQKSLMEDDKRGRVPLVVDVLAPIKIVLEDIKLKDLRVKLQCKMVVDHLGPGKNPKILSTEYSYNVEW